MINEKREKSTISPKRALEIWKNRSSGGDFHGVISRAEDLEIVRVWNTLPGDRSWVDTLLAISRGEHT